MFENLSDLTALSDHEMIAIDGGGFWSDFWDGVYSDLASAGTAVMNAGSAFTDGYHDSCGC